MDQISNNEITLEKARKTLGKTAEAMSDEQFQDQLNMIKFLVESWMDDYERSVFDGRTLNELLI